MCFSIRDFISTTVPPGARPSTFTFSNTSPRFLSLLTSTQRLPLTTSWNLIGPSLLARNTTLFLKWTSLTATDSLRTSTFWTGLCNWAIFKFDQLVYCFRVRNGRLLKGATEIFMRWGYIPTQLRLVKGSIFGITVWLTKSSCWRYSISFYQPDYSRWILAVFVWYMIISGKQLSHCLPYFKTCVVS